MFYQKTIKRLKNSNSYLNDFIEKLKSDNLLLKSNCDNLIRENNRLRSQIQQRDSLGRFCKK